MGETALIGPTLLALSRLPGVRVARMNTGALRDERGRLVRYGLPGLADIMGIVAPNGRMLCVELKTEIGRQSRQQKLFARMVERHGGIYVLARSVEQAVHMVITAIAASDASKTPACKYT